MSEDFEWCSSTLVQNGGEFRCRRSMGHVGIHMAESGDELDYGFYPKTGADKTWEIVADVKADLLAANRRLGDITADALTAHDAQIKEKN